MNRRLVNLSGHLAENLLAQGLKHLPNETGGILLGHVSQRVIEICDVIGPGPAAKHQPRNFSPDSHWQAAQVAAAWRQDTTLEYLGDWHTHPRGTPHPSPLDRQTLRDIAAAPRARQPEPLMLILAISDTGTASASVYQLRNGRLKKATLRMQ